jgi:hypothetical protein
MRLVGGFGTLFAFTLAMAAERTSVSASLPLAATTITIDRSESTLANVLDAFRKAGVPVDAPGLDPKMPLAGPLVTAPLWDALETLAKQTGTRIELHDQGKRVSLVKRASNTEPSCVRGPFRIVAKQVDGRRDLASGHTFQDVTLDVHWEPRIPVFRIDSVPTISVAKDDLGNALTASSASAMSPVSGAASHALPVRLMNVPRKACTIADLRGVITVTASDRMLPFAFANLGGKLPVAGTLPTGVAADGVSASLATWQLEELGGKKFWEATLHLSYPAGMPVFQSFETWLGENKLQLVSPRGIAIAPDQSEEPQPGREMTVVYRFDTAKVGGTPTDAGWSLVYDTPAPLVEFRVPFALKDIPLP